MLFYQYIYLLSHKKETKTINKKKKKTEWTDSPYFQGYCYALRRPKEIKKVASYSSTVIPFITECLFAHKSHTFCYFKHPQNSPKNLKKHR